MVLPLFMITETRMFRAEQDLVKPGYANLDMKGPGVPMAKEKFRDWNLYHKGIVAALAAFAVAVGIRAYLVYDGAFEVSAERVLDASAADIWPWVITNGKRADWQGEVLRIQGLSVDVGRKRLLSWKRGYERWQSFETTTTLVNERLFKSKQDSDFDTRWFEVELVPAGDCKTNVKLREIIQPTAYSERFWFFRIETERQQRLENSLDSLGRWAGSSGVCVAATDADIPQP